MKKIATIGLDLAKNVFHVHGIDNLGKVMVRRQLRRGSVNSGIRWPERMPPSKGGHLVLVTAASADTIRFHNPSGPDATSQADVTLPLAVFDRFFANRGIAVGF